MTAVTDKLATENAGDHGQYIVNSDPYWNYTVGVMDLATPEPQSYRACVSLFTWDHNTDKTEHTYLSPADALELARRLTQAVENIATVLSNGQE